MRTFGRILLAVLAGTVLFVGSLYLYIFKLRGAEKVVNAQISNLVEPQYNLDITVGNVSGDFLSGIVFEDVCVYYVDTNTRYQLVNIPRLSTAYSLSNLWEGKYILDYVYIDSATVTVKRDSSGHWLKPTFGSQGGTSAGGILSFAVRDLRINDLTVVLLRRMDTLSFDKVVLNASVESSENTYALDLRHFQCVSSDGRFSVSAAGGKVTYSQGAVVFQNVEVVRGGMRIKLNGSVKLKDILEGRVDFAADHLDLKEIGTLLQKPLSGVLDLNGSVMFVGEKIEGSVGVAGQFMFAGFENLFTHFRFDGKKLLIDTLYGTILGNCTVDGNGEVDFSASVENYRLNAEIKNFNLVQLVPNTFESDLTGRIELTGESFRGDELVLNIRTDMHESTFDEYPLQEAFGDLIVTSDSICFADSFRINYFENIFYLTGRIDYSDNIDLTIAADLHNLDRYRGKLFIDQPGGRGHADATISGTTADPDLRGLFVSDSVWVYGLYSSRFAASIEVERFLTGKQGTVEISYGDGTAWDLPYDSGYVFLSVDSDLVRIDALSMRNQYGKLKGTGLLEYGVDPMHMTIDSLTLVLYDQIFHNHSNIVFDIDSSGFNFQRAVIGTGNARLTVAGRVDYDESMNLQLSVDHTPIKPWVSLFDTTLSIDGLLSCEALVEGTFGQPRFNLFGSMDSLTYHDLQLGALVAGLEYDSRLLTLDSLMIRSATGNYRAAGSFHVNLAFTSDVVDRFPELPLNIDISATDHGFDLVSLVMPSVEQLDGDFFADITLSGTPHAPHLAGEAYVKNARLKYFDLEELIWADSAGVTMRDNRIIIDRIELYAKDKKGGRRGNAHLEGNIIVKSLDSLYYDLGITLAEEFPFSYELDDIRGVVKGNLHVEGDTPPLVTGTLTLVSMKYLVNFATEEQGSPVMYSLSGEDVWDLNLNIDILSKYWIKNEDIDAEFAGQINLIREKGVYRFIGEMEILRGRGFLFDKTFRLEPGSKVTFEGNPTINPRLDITGYTRIAGMRRSVGEEPETAEPLELGIRVTGTLEAPEINPVDESDFTREDILPLIVANYYSSDSVSSSGQFEQRLSGLISSQVSQIGGRQLAHLGVETFEIDPLYGGEYDPLKTRVTVGFYTAPNLYVYGRSTLSGQTRQEVGFEYRFNKALLLEGLRDEEELYRLAFKLHWEF